jgi:hypothetical protein
MMHGVHLKEWVALQGIAHITARRQYVEAALAAQGRSS